MSQGVNWSLNLQWIPCISTQLYPYILLHAGAVLRILELGRDILSGSVICGVIVCHVDTVRCIVVFVLLRV